MNALNQFLAKLVQGPQEVLAAIVRLLIMVLLFILYLFYWFIRLFKSKDKANHDRELKKDICGRIPPHVRRKPDPCIYSQFYRMSQGLSVTWNNPDIEICLPDGTPVDSSSLTSDTDYILKARISNSSFDPSLATAVRSFYRPWSFNSPDKVPIETLPDGSGKVVYLDIAPWGSKIAEFKWHTPNVASAHYCIQVECFHPEDVNPDNNLGQENTNVYAPSPGETITAKAFLLNVENRAREFTFFADAYQIQGPGADLRLVTRKFPVVKKTPFKGLKNYLLTFDQKDRRLTTRNNQGPFYTYYRYEGWEQFKAMHKRGNFPIPDGWGVTVEGLEVSTETKSIRLQGGEGREVEIKVEVPRNQEKGKPMPINVLAITPSGKIAGGVSLIIRTI